MMDAVWAATEPVDPASEADADASFPPEEAIRVPIGDELDLHNFHPAEVAELLDDYFKECVAAGILEVRVIHGKGKGILKKRVRAVLQRHPLVADYSDAGFGAGGWGATRVRLANEQPHP
jgi:DNA-nicking Smr family endonuclease